MAQFFPKWMNKIPVYAPVIGVLGLGFLVFVIWYYCSPWNLEVGYQPKQPVDYSHKTHADVMGLDCRYCHTGVDKSAVAGVPPTETCMNCHYDIKKGSLKLAPVYDSWLHDKPIEWVRVHKVPDYGYFDHSAHVLAGVGCISCHGRVDQMEKVTVVEPLSMGWCLDCHRNPAPHLRPTDKVTDMTWVPDSEWIKVAKARAENLHPPVESCSGCHR